MTRPRRFDTPLPFHPLLAPMGPLLLLTAASSDVTQASAVTWSLGVSVGTVIVAWIALWLVSRKVRASALAVTLLTFAFFLDIVPARIPIGLGFSLSPIFWVLVIAELVRIMRSRSSFAGVTVFANILVTISVVIAFGNIVATEFEGRSPRVKREVRQLDLTVRAGSSTGALPDVYLLVLDAYGRADVIRDLYGFENNLVPVLKSAGFYLADEAASNYAQTAQALASSLNLEYLPEFVEGDPADTSREPFRALIADNRVFNAFRDRGYRIVYYASEYSILQPRPGDVFRRPPFFLTDFEYGVYQATALPRLFALAGLPPSWGAHKVRRRHVNWTLDQLAEGRDGRDEQPTLVFAHVLVPHPPFVFAGDGSYPPTRMPATSIDGQAWDVAAGSLGESYENGYVESLRFVNRRVQEVIQGILARAERPTIIMLQGDHGPGARLVWYDKDQSDMRERLGILLAVRFPDGDYSMLHARLTSVNAMREILNRALGLNLSLLPDRSYFSTWAQPYVFHDVTDQVNPPSPQASRD